MMYYFGIAVFCTAVFIIQFILSFFLGDIDADIDIDGDGAADFSWSDLLSFKGLIHFGIGFGWTMWFNHGEENQWLAALFSVVVGLIFMFILWWVYRLTLKLESVEKTESGEVLVGRETEIYLKDSQGYKVFITKEGSKKLIYILSLSGKEYKPGDKDRIVKFENGNYYIN